MPHEDQMAHTLTEAVVQASSGYSGAERAPKRVAETRITLGVVAAREGDLEQAPRLGDLAFTGLPQAAAFIDHSEEKRP